MTNLERVEAMAGRAYGLHDVDRDALLWLLEEYREQGAAIASLEAHVDELQQELKEIGESE